VCKCLRRVIQCGSEVELEVEASVFEGEVVESQEDEAAEARDFLVVEAEVGETSVGKVVEPFVAEAEVVIEDEVVEAEVVHADEEVEVALEGEVVAKAEADRVAVGGGKVEEALVGVAEAVAEAVATFAVEGAGISMGEAVEVSEDEV